MPVGIANSKSGFWPGPSSTMVFFIEPVLFFVFVLRQVSKSKREQQIKHFGQQLLLGSNFEINSTMKLKLSSNPELDFEPFSSPMIFFHQFAPGTIISEAKTAGASSVRVSLHA